MDEDEPGDESPTDEEYRAEIGSEAVEERSIEERVRDLEIARQADKSERRANRAALIQLAHRISEDNDDFAYFKVAKVNSVEKAERLNGILNYMRAMARKNNGTYAASKTEIYEEHFRGDDGDIGLSTVGRYCRQEMPKVPGMKWGWPGPPGARVNTNEGKQLKFSVEKHNQEGGFR